MKKVKSLPIGSYMREVDVPFVLRYSLTETERYVMKGVVYVTIDEMKRLWPQTFRSLQRRVNTLTVTS